MGEQTHGNTVAFENTIPETDKQINARLVEIANQGPTLETTVTSHPDCRFQTDVSTQTTESTSIRVCTPTKIDPSVTTTIETTGRHGKTTPTEHATPVVLRDI